MLKRLVVEHIALIEEACLQLGSGLVAITGETGAGKTALLSALKLLVGERSDSSMIRDGATRCTVEGLFETDKGSFLVRRVVTADGRSRCWIDSKQVPVKELAAVVGPLLDLHGQHEHQRLLSREHHGSYLDAWIGQEAQDAAETYRCCFESHRAAQTKLENILQAARTSELESQARAFGLSEIEALHPSVEEYEQLVAEMPTLLNAEALAVGADTARSTLAADRGVLDLLSDAQAALGKHAGVDDTGDDLADRIAAASAELADVAEELRRWQESLDFDPQLLEAKMQRLSALEGLCKKYGPRMEDVLAFWEEAQRLAQVTDTSAQAIHEATEEVAQAEEKLLSAAALLKKCRDAQQDAFSAAMSQALDQLGMNQASVMAMRTDLPRHSWTLAGPEQVEFYYAPARAVAPRALNRIASGGELSRVMLALQERLHCAGDATLVFDEVDAGIGGATGTLVAHKLAQIAQSHQVIVVTHLASIAAKAEQQFSVAKTEDDLPITSILPVDGPDRVTEIARMLSGDSDAATMAHAMQLLEKDEGTKGA